MGRGESWCAWGKGVLCQIFSLRDWVLAFEWFVVVVVVVVVVAVVVVSAVVVFAILLLPCV